MGLRFAPDAAAFAVLPAAFRFAAQKAFMRAACFFRSAAVKARRFVGSATLAVVTCVLLAGLPRRLTGAPSASIARFSLSRSEIRRERICSVGILDEDIIERADWQS